MKQAFNGVAEILSEMQRHKSASLGDGEEIVVQWRDGIHRHVRPHLAICRPWLNGPASREEGEGVDWVVGHDWGRDGDGDGGCGGLWWWWC